MKPFLILIILSLALSCQSNAQKKENAMKTFPVTKTETEWRAQLTEIQYYVLREAGTEPAFTHEYNFNKEKGTYVCAACETPLFKSNYKYDSKSGWPSFDRTIEGNVDFSVDYDLGYARTEEHCATCGGHLGHVFDDGPRETTGKRHCVNGAALKFIPKKKN